MLRKSDWVVKFWHPFGSVASEVTLIVKASGPTSATAVAFRQWVESGVITRADASDHNVRAYKVRS